VAFVVDNATPAGSDASPELVGSEPMKSRDDHDGVGCTEDGFGLESANSLPVDSVSLEERILLLERQNIDLQKLVCELLKKNQELRMGRWDLVSALAAR
jgi:hypothetical protein